MILKNIIIIFVVYLFNSNTAAQQAKTVDNIQYYFNYQLIISKQTYQQ